MPSYDSVIRSHGLSVLPALYHQSATKQTLYRSDARRVHEWPFATKKQGLERTEPGAMATWLWSAVRVGGYTWRHGSIGQRNRDVLRDARRGRAARPAARI